MRRIIAGLFVVCIVWALMNILMMCALGRVRGRVVSLEFRDSAGKPVQGVELLGSRWGAKCCAHWEGNILYLGIDNLAYGVRVFRKPPTLVLVCIREGYEPVRIVYPDAFEQSEHRIITLVYTGATREEMIRGLEPELRPIAQSGGEGEIFHK